MKTWFALLLLMIAGRSFAQQATVTHNYTNIKPAEWIIPKTDTLSYEYGIYASAKALILKRKFGNYKSASVAYPKTLHFKDGIIELDIASPTGKAGYVGMAFRIADAHHYETLYFRPGSSGTINAIQYMPKKKAEFNWWDYEAEKYQAKSSLPLTAWFHVKVIVKGRMLTVFVNDQPKPVMTYSTLDPDLKTGSVGFWLGNSASGAYKNLVVKTF
ncbi:hypothetical protein SNE25_12510 [Mucilaginibacter sabulilitoris]|uniref:3-keto-disaccharide hydrolase domain-containing protein n=1 Tax=Mucilaginibacter sabulilitoris TaxID=1173583 RepID=A0ABZ0TTB7_9SPHI|nr:hypothetical protein [Mucilaginibacter sabulilitoris]WPU96341.1 hypothetical protein SNE25_12510 [Mucilaginibacter sabulilitoris]